MSNVLLIQSSIFGSRSRSLALARDFLSRHYPGQAVTERVLTPVSMPHLDGETAAAFAVPEAQRTARQKELLALSDTLIGELEKADTIVLAVPMYNFSIPSALKAWIDHIARAGRTFRYTAQGPEGLLKDKKAVVLTARGGHYSGQSPFRSFDYQEPYLRAALGFLGVSDVTFIHLEGLNISQDEAAKGLERAKAEIDRLEIKRAAA